MLKKNIIQISIVIIMIALVGCSSDIQTNQNNDVVEASPESEKPDSSEETPKSNEYKSLAEGEFMVIVFDRYFFDLNDSLMIEDVKELTANELAILRNAYYAKYGYIFSKKEYSDFFNKFSWYDPISRDVESKLNATDKESIEIIIEEEKKLEKLKNTKLYPVMDSNFKWGYIDSQGNLMIDYIYEHADFFNEGVATVGINGTEGLIGTDGKYVIRPRFSSCSNYSEGWAHIVTKDNNEYRHGFANIEGQVFYRDYFNNNTGSFNSGLAVFEINHKFGYVNTNGEIVIEPQYLCAFDFSEGLAMVVNDNSKCGFIDSYGELVIPFKYEYHPMQAYLYQGFHDGLAVVREDNKYGYVNTKGEYVASPIYDYANEFSEGLAAVSIDDKWGYINKMGEMVIESQFDYATSFHNGFAYAKPLGEEYYYFGVIDKNGNFITPINIVYDHGGGYTLNAEWSSFFHDGLARVVIADETGLKYVYINETGEIIWEMD